MMHQTIMVPNMDLIVLAEEEQNILDIYYIWTLYYKMYKGPKVI